MKPKSMPGSPTRPATGSSRRTVRRVLAGGAVGSGMLSASLYVWGSPTLATVAAVATLCLGAIAMLIDRLRGAHRDITYRATVDRIPNTAVTDGTILAMAAYEAIASRQLEPAAVAAVLDAAFRARESGGGSAA